MEIRTYENGDRKALGHLLALAFGGPDEEGEAALDSERNRRLDPSRIYVAEEDGEPRATATVLPMQVYVDAKPVPMGGLAAVATHPAYRRRRLAGELMRTVLYAMRECGLSLSMLDPFNHSFYRAHGYELAAETLGYSLIPEELPKSPEQSQVRAYREADLPAMRRMLEREASRHQICVRRSEGRWKEALDGKPGIGKEGSEAAVYEQDGKVEGYLLYRQGDGSEGKRLLRVPEMVACTERAREALISFMASYDPRDWRIDHASPHGEPLHPFLVSSYVEARIRPGMMLRIVDVEDALSHLSRPVPQPLVLEVIDDTIPENAGAYTVGEGNVVRGAAAPERARLDVRQLAQLYAGYLSAEQLHRRGLVTPGSEKALELLEAIFPPCDPWVFPLDHF